MPDWNGIFSLTAPPLGIVVRGTVTFLALTLMMRIVGQRESGGLGITDVLIVVLVVDAASAGLTGDASSILDGFLLVVTVLFWSVVLDALSYRWPGLARLLKAKGQPLIEEGRLVRHTMRREFMTHEEVLSQLRLHGFQHVGQVRRAYLEPNGMISVIPYDGAPQDQPPRPPAI